MKNKAKVVTRKAKEYIIIQYKTNVEAFAEDVSDHIKAGYSPLGGPIEYCGTLLQR